MRMVDASAAHDFIRDARTLFAGWLSRVSGTYRPEIERAFLMVRREDFFPAGPWLASFTGSGYVPTPSADPIWLQQNLLFAIDAEKGINNGEPSLHASWLAAISPKPGERVIHIGCGNGFYSAILASLVGPMGDVAAYEIETAIAATAERNLAHWQNVTVVASSAALGILPEGDLIYVNAGAPQLLTAWLDALRPGGRLVFPWQPDDEFGVSMLVTQTPGGFTARVLGPSRFIPLRTDVKRPSMQGGHDS